MHKRIHILGASASGTTTLAEALSAKTGYDHFDTDDYFWVPTEVIFTQKRSVEERQMLLRQDLEAAPQWILSGSLCGWGDIFIPYFDLVVFLYLPKEIRLQRLLEREKQRYGADIDQYGIRELLHKDFYEWASQYDEAGTNMRSKALHEQWLSKLPCPVLRIEGDKSIEERLGIVLEAMNNKGGEQ
ncbi:MAG: AAA family ATPase [Bacillota bacterium]